MDDPDLKFPYDQEEEGFKQAYNYNEFPPAFTQTSTRLGKEKAIE